jgi:hypothetical protein
LPVVLGIILGAVLTITGAFIYDSATGRVENGLPPAAANGNAPIVNWSVLNEHWQSTRLDLEKFGTDVETGWKRITATR